MSILVGRIFLGDPFKVREKTVLKMTLLQIAHKVPEAQVKD